MKTELTITFIRKIVTLRILLNRILRQPKRIEYNILPSGAVTKISYFNNKQII